MKVFFSILVLLIFGTISFAQDKPSIIILTDIGGDPDDQQSLVRFLLYSDQFDVKAICATSRMEHGHDIRDDLILDQLEAYGAVYPNLLLHSSEYPSPEYLRSVIRIGQGDETRWGEGTDSQASDAIIDVVDHSDQTVYIVVWGGQRELVQALWKVNENRNPEGVKTFCQKIQVRAIGDQDDYRSWVLNHFPDIQYVAIGFTRNDANYGIREISAFRGMYMTGDRTMQNGQWVEEHIHGHGPLGEQYPIDGAGTDGMKEGDTPSFLGLISNGLNSPENPHWGGWGGRYRKIKDRLFIDAPDFLDGMSNERHSVSRWRPVFQNDFMARMDWCVQSFDNANHNPKVVVNQSAGVAPLLLSVQNGQQIHLDASHSSDPDGDDLSYRWFIYEEISPGSGCDLLEISENGEECYLTIPENLPPGRTIHLILEVSDDGTPSLTSYRRMVVIVQ